jgi:mannose-1-phosphate guanylyltransferase
MKSGGYKDHLFALILAGGGGTRLWPRSRNKTPKQFLNLFKNKTLTQITLQRFSRFLPWDRIYCVTVSEEYKREILKEVPLFKARNIVVEPARRDTAPAHGIGAAYIYKKDPDAVIITESADRLVEPIGRYLTILKAAAKIAYEEKMLIALGVKPRYPHTGLGHIKRGKKHVVLKDVHFFKLDKFIEKPPLALAKRYTASINYYWNAGEFVWRADTLLAQIAKYAPEISKQLSVISKSFDTKNEAKVLEKCYKAMPKISIDYAVAEKAKNFLVVEGDFFWTDIGDWREVWNNLAKDEAGNVIIDGDEPGGEIINIDTSDALIHKNGRMIAVIDVDNVVIVDTKDALLVCSKSRAQNVKKIVEKLKNDGSEELL